MVGVASVGLAGRATLSINPYQAGFECQIKLKLDQDQNIKISRGYIGVVIMNEIRQ